MGFAHESFLLGLLRHMIKAYNYQLYDHITDKYIY